MPAPRIAVVDYGVNNIGSVLNMLRRLGIAAAPATRAEDVASASALILPGIGAFDAGVKNLRSGGLFDAIQARVRGGTPILGICLGMQLLGRGSEEGSLEGLGLLPATTKRFPFRAERGHRPGGTPDEGSAGLKIPHMGWNETTPRDPELFANLTDPRFYYVHSFHVVCDDPRDVAATCRYGIDFTAAVRRGHVMGTQFHPEKSHRFGMRVLESFARLTGVAQEIAVA